MATVNLGRIKPVFRGAYDNSTAYVIDDIVTSGNETFIAIAATQGNATSDGSKWTKLAAKGADGTDVGTTLTAQGDILYRDGSGLARLGYGTSGQALVTKGSGQNPVWESVGSDFTPNFLAYRTDTFSFNSTTSTMVSFNLEKYDSDNAYNTSNYKFTVPSGEGGKYFLYCMLRKNNFSGSRFFYQMKRNVSGGGTEELITAENSYGGDTYVGIFGQTIYPLTAGDEIWVEVYHNDSGSRELITDITCCYFGGYKLTS